MNEMINAILSTRALTADDWSPHLDFALAGIASVSVVVWTGGLIAYQLKQYTVARSIGLEVLQAAFIGSILGLFLYPTALRIVALIFTLLYVRGFLWGLFVQFRDVDATRKTFGAKVSALQNDELVPIWIAARRYLTWSLASMLFYVVVVVWPYPKVLAWDMTAMLFVGLQVVTHVLNNTPDQLSWESSKISSLTTIMTQLGTIISQLSIIVPTKPSPGEPPQESTQSE